ncbi:MAG: ADP-forming succinate--CoA ligase subunit beta [Puniceicoccales bacterium]|nr:ADP-forming succinate--CoA ligase subunit beta [Puniceicoccales bacterium]
MNIHEYQAKLLLKKFQIPAPEGICIKSCQPDVVEKALNAFGEGKMIVVKAQIHAGGRGQGCFVENGCKGVRCARNKQEAHESIHAMLGHTLVTRQTGPKGKRVRKVYLTEGIRVQQEFYVSILVDCEHYCPVLIASAEGGTEIETLAQTSPEKLLKILIDPLVGLTDFQARHAAFFLQLAPEVFPECVQLLKNLYRLFMQADALLVEINPLVLNEDGHLMALDAKIQLDDNALFRHKDYGKWTDDHEKDPKEVEAAKAKLNYIALDGDIACLVNGAGLAMATMDMIQHFGGRPANFLDVGGSASAEQIQKAFKIILKDPCVRGIFINVFGGILRCDLLAEAIVTAAQSTALHLPMVVRLKGTNVERAHQILRQSALPLVTSDTLEAATKEIIRRARGV